MAKIETYTDTMKAPYFTSKQAAMTFDIEIFNKKYGPSVLNPNDYARQLITFVKEQRDTARDEKYQYGLHADSHVKAIQSLIDKWCQPALIAEYLKEFKITWEPGRFIHDCFASRAKKNEYIKMAEITAAYQKIVGEKVTTDTFDTSKKTTTLDLKEPPKPILAPVLKPQPLVIQDKDQKIELKNLKYVLQRGYKGQNWDLPLRKDLFETPTEKEKFLKELNQKPFWYKKQEWVEATEKELTTLLAKPEFKSYFLKLQQSYLETVEAKSLISPQYDLSTRLVKDQKLTLILDDKKQTVTFKKFNERFFEFSLDNGKTFKLKQDTNYFEIEKDEKWLPKPTEKLFSKTDFELTLDAKLNFGRSVQFVTTSLGKNTVEDFTFKGTDIWGQLYFAHPKDSKLDFRMRLNRDTQNWQIYKTAKWEDLPENLEIVFNDISRSAAAFLPKEGNLHRLPPRLIQAFAKALYNKTFSSKNGDIRASEIIQCIHQQGYETFVVGGCVRDAINALEENPDISSAELEKLVHDIDIVTTMPFYRLEFLKDAFFAKGVEISNTFNLIGLVTFGPKATGLDVVSMRADEKLQTDHSMRKFGNSLTLDMLARDLTCNSLCVDLRNGLLIDASGRGLSAVRDKRLDILREEAEVIYRYLKFRDRGYQPGPEAIQTVKKLIDMYGGDSSSLKNVAKRQTKKDKSLWKKYEPILQKDGFSKKHIEIIQRSFNY